MPPTRSLALVTSFAAILAACGATTAGGRGGSGSSVEVPREITGETYGEWLRKYMALPLDDGGRGPLRERLLAHLATRTPDALENGDHAAVVAHFARMSSLLTPEDFAEGRIPAELRPLAERLVASGSPIGDEARVLSAELVLSTLDPRGGHDRRYETVSTWGRDARAGIASAIERYSRLVDVWQEHARLTPRPDVLAFLARLYVERRDAVLRIVPGGAQGLELPRGMSFSDLRAAPLIIRRAPLDVAGVYLAQGDVVSALAQVEAMGDSSGSEMSLVRVLRDARDGDDDAQVELALAYATGLPHVARGLCAAGLRRSPRDHRYPLCLARTEASQNDFAMATGWYAEAIRIAPNERALYDEALDNLGAFIARGLLDSDPRDARSMARAAETILDERTRRFPGTEPAVTADKLHFVVGLLEMNAGNPDEARRRLEASVAARETPDALLELGRLSESTGRPEDAARYYRRALDLTSGEGAGPSLARAEILHHLGDAFGASREPDQATRMYRQALELYDAARLRLEGRDLARVEVSRGILLDGLGRPAEAVVAFRRAMEVSPGEREVYARILSHLVVSAPNVELANEVLLRVQRELTLEPEWKVYFALWVDVIAARAGADSGTEAREVLRVHSRGDAWWGSLARFGSGDLPYEQLLSHATNVGQRTEAHFYEGARLLRAGDREGADRLFRRVLETRMVNFYEFTMARELVSSPP